MQSTLTLLELAVQGVAGLPPSGRFALRAGLNAVGGEGEVNDAFVRALAALLFTDAPPLAGGSTAKAALSFLAGDGETYRLMGTASGERALSRLDVAAGKFAPQSDLSAEKILRESGLPERKVFEALFLLSGPLPIPKAPVVQAAPTPLRAAPVGIESRFAQLADQVSAQKLESPAAIRARLAELELEDSEAVEMEGIQFQLDGLQQQLFQAEDALKGLDNLEVEVKSIEAELAKLPDIDADTLGHVKRLPQLTQKRDEALKRLAEERAALESRGEVASLADLASHRPFVISLVFGAVVIAVAVVGSQITSVMRFVALLDIPAFAIAAAVAVQRLSDIRQHEGLSRRLALLTERETRIHKAFESESLEVTGLMKSLGVEGSGELEERLNHRNAAQQRRDEALAKLNAARAEDAADGRRALRDRVRTEVADFEARLASFGGFRRDRAEIRRELESVRAELSKHTGGAAGAELSLDDAPAADEAAALFRLAGELFAMSPGMLLTTVKDRMTQLVIGLTEKRFTGLGFAPDGQVTLQRGSEPAQMFSQVVPKDRGLLLLGLRLALMERYLGNHRLVIILDQKSAALDEVRQLLVVKFLKVLSRSAQVLWMGSGATDVADHRLRIG